MAFIKAVVEPGSLHEVRQGGDLKHIKLRVTMHDDELGQESASIVLSETLAKAWDAMPPQAQGRKGLLRAGIAHKVRNRHAAWVLREPPMVGVPIDDAEVDGDILETD